MNSQTILMSQTLQRCRCLDLGFTVAVVEALAFGGQDMFDGLTRQTDCLALLKVSGSGLLFSTASCLCCSRGLSIGVGSQLWGHRRHTALTALQGVLGFLLFSRHKLEMPSLLLSWDTFSKQTRLTRLLSTKAKCLRTSLEVLEMPWHF